MKLGDGYLQVAVRLFALVLFMPAFFGALLWLLLAKTLPWAYTRTLGEQHEVRAMMRTEHRYSRRGCDYRLKGSPLERTFLPYVCISADYYDAHPDQNLEVLLIGKKSVLGFSIVEVRGPK